MNDKPGRNAPCPCGSGKKFKKCCGFDLPREAEAFLEPISDDMRTGTKVDLYFESFRGVLLYAETLKASSKFGTDLRHMWRDFEERFKPGTEDGLYDSFFMNWFALDNRFGVDQRTAVERMMDEVRFKTVRPEVQEAIRTLSDSYSTCYVVKKLREDAIIFEELATGIQWTVYRIGDPYEEEAKPGVIWHARFVGPRTGAYYFGQPFIFDPEAKADFTKIAKAQVASFKEYASTRSLAFEIPRDAFKASVRFWAEYFYRGSERDEGDDDEDMDGAGGGPAVSTTDGEKIRFSSVVLKIVDDNGLAEKLSRMNALEYDADNGCWVWLKKGNRRMKSLENTLLGRIFIRGKELVGEVNSLERALRLKNKLSIGLGKLVEFDRIDSKDMAAMPPMSEEERRAFEEAQRRIHADPEVRKELLRRLEEYYLKNWIASRIPALDNKTPLQALKTREGRLQLEALINQMEGMNAARPDYLPVMDMNILRRKLGLPLAQRTA